jgi:hypothetical protein
MQTNNATNQQAEQVLALPFLANMFKNCFYQQRSKIA